MNKRVNIIFIILYSESLFEERNVYVQLCKIKNKTLFHIRRALWWNMLCVRSTTLTLVQTRISSLLMIKTISHKCVWYSETFFTMTHRCLSHCIGHNVFTDRFSLPFSACNSLLLCIAHIKKTQYSNSFQWKLLSKCISVLTWKVRFLWGQPCVGLGVSSQWMVIAEKEERLIIIHLGGFPQWSLYQYMIRALFHISD